MHAFLHILAAGTATTTKPHKSSGSSTVTLLFIVVLFGAVYLLFIRPRQQRMRQQHTQARQLAVGDEVVTAGGIQGKLVALDDEAAEVEVAPGVVLTFLRRAVNAKPGAPAAATSPPADDEWSPPSRDEEPPPSDEPEHKP
jgi:preprotein translocase subunit YajC